MSESTADGPSNSRDQYPSRGLLALILICLAQLMVVIDSTIVNIALPRISSSLSITGPSLSWLITGYALALGGFLLLGGRLGDVFGRRRMFVVGLLVFALASGIGGLAQNESMLLAARVAQGLGAAVASPAALALITTTFPAGPSRTRAFGAFSATAGIGGGVGLVLGGWLTGLDPELGWRLTLLINVPIGLVAASLAPRALAESVRQRHKFDIPGAVLGTVGLLSIVYGVTRTGDTGAEGQMLGWSDPLALAAIAAGLLLLLTFVLVERRTRAPMLPLSIFADRQRAAAFLAMTLTPAALFSMLFFLSLYIQDVMGFSPLQTGLAFLPFTLGTIVGATLASRLLAYIAPRFISGTGALFAAVALFMFGQLDTVDDPASIIAAASGAGSLGHVNYWLEIAPFVLLMSVGIGFIFVPLTVVAMHRLPSSDVGVGSGVLNAVQQVGGAMGLAVLSAIAAPVIASAVERLSRGLAAAEGASAIQPARVAESLAFAGFSHGATVALLGGAALLAVAAVLLVTQLSIKPKDLSEV